nr:uncharacterized protein LOC122271008 [Parasteatoda tepidariorum]
MEGAPSRHCKRYKFLRSLIFWSNALLLFTTIVKIIYVYDRLYELCSLRKFVPFFAHSPMEYGFLFLYSISVLVYFAFPPVYDIKTSSYYNRKEFRLSYVLTVKGILKRYLHHIQEKLDTDTAKERYRTAWKSQEKRFQKLLKKNKPKDFLTALHEAGHLIGFWYTTVDCYVRTASIKPYQNRKQGIEVRYTDVYSYAEVLH